MIDSDDEALPAAEIDRPFQPDWRLTIEQTLAVHLRLLLMRSNISAPELTTDQQWEFLASDLVAALKNDSISPIEMRELPRSWDKMNIPIAEPVEGFPPPVQPLITVIEEAAFTLQPPTGYKQLPEGVLCRCARLWYRKSDNSHWCCCAGDHKRSD